MVRTLLVRGMLVGLVAGLLAFVWAYLVGEPPVEAAIAVEEAAAAAAGEVDGAPPEVSRDVQSTLGLLLGILIFATAVGGFLGLVFAMVYGRIGQLRARATALVLCSAAFVCIAIVPLTKYPANPPAVGSGDTIGERTGWFFVLIVIAIVAAVAAGRTIRDLSPRWGVGNAVAAGLTLFVGLIIVAHLALPNENEVAAPFPPQILWDFRLANLGTQAIIWAALAFGFGHAAERAIAGQPLLGRRDRATATSAV
jgi:hypothetical protein